MKKKKKLYQIILPQGVRINYKDGSYLLSSCIETVNKNLAIGLMEHLKGAYIEHWVLRDNEYYVVEDTVRESDIELSNVDLWNKYKNSPEVILTEKQYKNIRKG